MQQVSVFAENQRGMMEKITGEMCIRDSLQLLRHRIECL